MEDTSTHRMQDKLNEELRRRLEQLYLPPHSESECFASTRPILWEALIWVAFAFAAWIATVTLL
jgi:hypothetical protein